MTSFPIRNFGSGLRPVIAASPQSRGPRQARLRWRRRFILKVDFRQIMPIVALSRSFMALARTWRGITPRASDAFARQGYSSAGRDENPRHRSRIRDIRRKAMRDAMGKTPLRVMPTPPLCTHRRNRHRNATCGRPDIFHHNRSSAAGSAQASSRSVSAGRHSFRCPPPVAAADWSRSGSPVEA